MANLLGRGVDVLTPARHVFYEVAFGCSVRPPGLTLAGIDRTSRPGSNRGIIHCADGWIVAGEALSRSPGPIIGLGLQTEAEGTAAFRGNWSGRQRPSASKAC
jgi:hypothetical protein